MHLSVNDYDPRSTVRAFRGIVEGTASDEEVAAVEVISSTLHSMLKLYQQGVTLEALAMNSLTRFYDTNKVAEAYPELSKLLRKNVKHSAS